MKENEHISDELLAKYMGGKATPDEEEAVLDYLSENDDNLDDFIHINEAVALNNIIEANRRHKRKKMVRYISAAAAAVFLLIVVSFFTTRHPEEQNGQFVQEHPSSHGTLDSTIVISDNDTIKTPPTKLKSNNPDAQQTPISFEAKHYADSSRKIKYANMVYPSQKRTSISKDKKHVSFRWNTDAVAVYLNVKSDNGSLLADQQLTSEKYYKVSLPENVDTLLWHVVFKYADGTTFEQSGTIIRWDTGLEQDD